VGDSLCGEYCRRVIGLAQAESFSKIVGVPGLLVRRGMRSQDEAHQNIVCGRVGRVCARVKHPRAADGAWRCTVEVGNQLQIFDGRVDKVLFVLAEESMILETRLEVLNAGLHEDEHAHGDQVRPVAIQSHQGGVELCLQRGVDVLPSWVFEIDEASVDETHHIGCRVPFGPRAENAGIIRTHGSVDRDVVQGVVVRSRS